MTQPISSRKLSEILIANSDGVAQVFGVKEANPIITGLASDSRLVAEGNLFFALDGVKFKGGEFIPEAIKKGAAAVVTGRNGGAAAMMAMESAEPRRVLADAAARFYPRQPETIVAVTGTNGKTSVANLCQQIWEGLGFKAASIGTLGVKRHSSDAPNAGLTTPDTISLHRILQELADEDFTHVAIEASSHGLDQYRLDGVKISAAGFTNLTQDHLDYHATMEDYFKAKSRLFSQLLDLHGHAVINNEDGYSERIVNICRERGIDLMTYGRMGFSNNIDLAVVDSKGIPSGLTVSLQYNNQNFVMNVPFFADFQVSNLLCSMGLVIKTGVEFELLVKSGVVSSLQNIPGRFEKIKTVRTDKSVFLDYAHTPDGLETVLRSLVDYRNRSNSKGKIILVFGCGGDRDKKKRPIMGNIANRLADIAIVTDDNPRTELANIIRSEIINGMTGAEVKTEIIEIDDRAAAIKLAIDHADNNDIVIIAGKGHETGQIIGSKTVHFSDLEEINKWI